MKMKFFAAAAMVAGVMAAAPAFAADGTIDANYVNISGNAVGTSTDAYSVNFATSSAPAAGEVGFQLNAHYMDGNNVPSQYTAAQVTVFKQNADNLWGGYGAYQNSFGSTKTWEVGAVGQTRGASYTVTGQFGYGQVTNTSPHVAYWAAGGNAVFYANDNLSFGGTLNYLAANQGNGSITIVGAQAEWQPATMPVSFLASYNNQSASGGGGHANIVSVGARWNFGGKTLKERDQSGVISGLVTRMFF